MWSDDEWTWMEDWDACSLCFCPSVVPLKGNELMFVASAATCCAALYRTRVWATLRSATQGEEDDDCHDEELHRFL